MNHKCESCAHWSNDVARWTAETGLAALCMCALSENGGRMTQAQESCVKWSSNDAFDSLPDDHEAPY